MVMPSALAPQGGKWTILFLPLHLFLTPPPLFYFSFFGNSFHFPCFASSASHTHFSVAYTFSFFVTTSFLSKGSRTVSW